MRARHGPPSLLRLWEEGEDKDCRHQEGNKKLSLKQKFFKSLRIKTNNLELQEEINDKGKMSDYDKDGKIEEKEKNIQDKKLMFESSEKVTKNIEDFFI